MAVGSKPGLRDNRVGVIPYLAVEPDEFDAEVKKYRAGEMGDSQFTPWRLRRGVYGQRQPEAQMMRIKFAGGLGTADQIDALANAIELHAPLNKGHITTRECIQVHFVKLEDAPKVMRIIGDAGLSTREACGNTVRNVISDPLVGIDPKQAFDITPYIVAYVRKFVRHPVTQTMPRKFKSAFSSGEHDPAVVPMHDIGFVARVRVIDGVERKGFKIVIGGGTSIMAKLAQPLYEFVPVEDYLKVSEAVLRVFNQADELRANKMMARIKVLVHRKGIDAVRALVEEEFKKPWAGEDPKNWDPIPLMDWLRETPPAMVADTGAGAGNKEFQLWKATNCVEQAQKGYYAAFVKVPRGDLSPDQFRDVARLARAFGSGTVALGAEQNLALRWVPAGKLFALWQELDRMGLGEGEVHSITDMTSCPGTDSCKLGITSSMGLNRAVSDAVRTWDDLLEDPLIKKLHIKASGCPNGCGRHHVANIGFHGASIKGPEGHQVPAYEMFMGGSFEDGVVRYGDRIKAKVPAKQAPHAIRRVLDYYQANRKSGEEFNAFVQRVGTEPFEAILSEFREVGPLNKDTMPMYMDWGKTILYKLERGEGECAV
ncbi:MAG: nitrite/sulfite reductase [SAR202 cluster bacterium]|nr:nitrite/sulfite reductase [SAR202 cluster bacterium]